MGKAEKRPNPGIGRIRHATPSKPFQMAPKTRERSNRNSPVVLPHWNRSQCFHIGGKRRFAKANRRTLVALPNQSQQRTKPMCDGGGEANVHSRHLLAQSRRRITTNAHFNCTTLKPAMQPVSPMQLLKRRERRHRKPTVRPIVQIGQQCSKAVTNSHDRDANRVLTRNRCPMGNHSLQQQKRNPTRKPDSSCGGCFLSLKGKTLVANKARIAIPRRFGAKRSKPPSHDRTCRLVVAPNARRPNRLDRPARLANTALLPM